MKNLALIVFISFFFCVGNEVKASNYKIYGKITTVENYTFTGFITWNKKIYWTDLFKASKPNNPFSKYFKDSGVKFTRSNGTQSSTPTTHVFSCRMGNIKFLRPLSNSSAEICIKDGSCITIKKGSFNDIGTTIWLYSPDAGNISFKWDKISQIEFMDCPETEYNNLNVPITGIVKTQQGIYKGFVLWDMDEKHLDAVLDGRTSTGDQSIPFGNIHKIVKIDNASLVTLKNGSEFRMWGSNDVNNQNRGIAVNMPNIGLVRIPWSKFETFEAVDISEVETLSYENFPLPQRIYGEVKCQNGDLIKGVIAYDLDETMDFEVLDGKNDNINYEIPFRYISSIEPKNYKYSLITLTNGSKISLGELSDVSNLNEGLLVFPPYTSPVYIPWKEIVYINFTPN